jgi:hypothetical protein
MKNPKTTSVLVGLGLVLVVAYGYAQANQGHQWTTSLTDTFINNTGQAVGGLHIQYNNIAYGSIFIDQNPATFGNVQVDGTAINLSSGTLATGGSVQINAYTWGGIFRGNVQKWWWTDGSGILVGQTHTGCRNPDCTTP